MLVLKPKNFNSSQESINRYIEKTNSQLNSIHNRDEYDFKHVGSLLENKNTKLSTMKAVPLAQEITMLKKQDSIDIKDPKKLKPNNLEIDINNLIIPHHKNFVPPSMIESYKKSSLILKEALKNSKPYMSINSSIQTSKDLSKVAEENSFNNNVKRVS